MAPPPAPPCATLPPGLSRPPPRSTEAPQPVAGAQPNTPVTRTHCATAAAAGGGWGFADPAAAAADGHKNNVGYLGVVGLSAAERAAAVPVRRLQQTACAPCSCRYQWAACVYSAAPEWHTSHYQWAA